MLLLKKFIKLQEIDFIQNRTFESGKIFFQKLDWFFKKITFPIQEKFGVHFSVESMHGYSITFNSFVLELSKKNRTKILYKVHWKAPLSEFVF